MCSFAGKRRTNIDTIIVPVAAGHILVDIRIDARHLDEERMGRRAPVRRGGVKTRRRRARARARDNGYGYGLVGAGGQAGRQAGTDTRNDGIARMRP
jgi:hypothetical protein